MNFLPWAAIDFNFSTQQSKYLWNNFTFCLGRIWLLIPINKIKICEAPFFFLDVSSKTIGTISGTFGCTAGISGGLSMSLRASDAFIIPSTGQLWLVPHDQLLALSYTLLVESTASWGQKGKRRKSALQIVSTDFTLFPWKSCGCLNSCPKAGTAYRRGIYSSKWWWLILSCHGKCFCTLMSENCIIIITGLMFPCQSCVFAPRIQNEHRKLSGWLPRASFGERTKGRLPSQPGPPGSLIGSVSLSLTHQPTSLPQAGGSPNFAPLPLRLSRWILVCPPGPFGNPR